MKEDDDAFDDNTNNTKKTNKDKGDKETNDEMNRIGLSTKEAVNILCTEIQQVLDDYEHSQRIRNPKSWIFNALHHTSPYTSLNWISTTCLLISAISLIITYVFTSNQSSLLIYEALFIIGLLSLSVTLEIHDNKLRVNELSNRIKILLEKIKKKTKNVDNWPKEYYPNLFSPYSPCITLQWTFRDNKIVNLPWALLVKNDIIVIRPGQVCPGLAQSYDNEKQKQKTIEGEGEYEYEYETLHAKEIYGPSLQDHNEMFSMPKARQPLENKKYRLLETPYISNLKLALEESLNKPITPQNRQRHLLMIRFVERLLLPISVLLIIGINLIRVIYLKEMFGKNSYVELFILEPIGSALPLLPLVFPLIWYTLNYLGMARFKYLFETTIKSSGNNDGTGLTGGGGGGGSKKIDINHSNIHQKKKKRTFVNVNIGNDEEQGGDYEERESEGSSMASSSFTSHDSYIDLCGGGGGNEHDEDEHEFESELNINRIKYDLHTVWTYFLDVFLGKEYILHRSSNILHVLGSVTALCCVDKKGILSWPNPTAEKVFFLHNSSNTTTTTSSTNVVVNSNLNNPVTDDKQDRQLSKDLKEDKARREQQQQQEIVDKESLANLNELLSFSHQPNQGLGQGDANKKEDTVQIKKESKEKTVTVLDVEDGNDDENMPLITVSEVLDITHDQTDPFKLHFDDTKWHEHINSLKPLGLAILLNTCNTATQEKYTEFCSHITCEAMYNENLVPVTNRRCLCELAKEIGFVDEAQKIFNLELQLSTFRHLQPEVMLRKDNKFARSLSMSSTKLKFPFPHMFAVIVKELSSGASQLLSQGTADIILDSCVDFWDGHDLCPLTPSDRKKIQDFYQRSSLTAYCTAFAYRPLSCKGVISDKLEDIYLELPSDCRHLYHLHRSPTPIHWECKSVLEPKTITTNNGSKHIGGGQFYSTDSLLCNDVPIGSGINGTIDVIASAEDCFEMQCNQIFIGMVTMQYQAQADMVHLIEQLERACIRFVHFSKENELRSRVFSEKMGLESGWNCHISLLSERTRKDSIGGVGVGPSECWANNGTARISSPTDMPLHIWQQKRQHSVKLKKSTATVLFKKNTSNLQSSRTMSFSAPSAINTEHTIVKFDMDNETIQTQHQQQHKSLLIEDNDNNEQQNSTSHDSLNMNVNNINANEWNSSLAHDWQSLSCLTDSTEQSAPINFDMSNRAKLPRGIDKIRPHIELIDNVPLLVSLFTDCTASGTREMLQIMQDYNEVICVVGSSANSENMSIFMQADASIAIEPLYPQVCQKDNYFNFNNTKQQQQNSTSNKNTNQTQKDDKEKEKEKDKEKMEEEQPIIELSRMLNSIASSLSIRRDKDPLTIYALIMNARHYTSCLWNTVQFWLCCCITVSFIQMSSITFMLPPILSIGQVMYICYIIVPLLSVSLMGIKVDPETMKRPQAKNQLVFNVEVIFFILWCYGVKFLPVILSGLCAFISVLINDCYEICSRHLHLKCTCKFLYIPTIVNSAARNLNLNSTASSVIYNNNNHHVVNIVEEWMHEDHQEIIASAQNFAVFIIVINLATVSSSFVHRLHSLCNKKPYTNLVWVYTVTLVALIQIAYFVVQELENEDSKTPYYFGILGLFTCLITFGINELLKKEEIKTISRHHRRARLDFGTKLGMNSPF